MRLFAIFILALVFAAIIGSGCNKVLIETRQRVRTIEEQLEQLEQRQFELEQRQNVAEKLLRQICESLPITGKDAVIVDVN